VLLDIKDLHCHYGALEAVKGVSMGIAEGSIVGLLGANGSGKSTILKTVSGLMKPTQGEIWFDGRREDGVPAHKVVRNGIAHVPEGRQLFPYMTVFENLKMGAYCRKDKEGIEKESAGINLKRWRASAVGYCARFDVQTEDALA
jgi:branched-chain amino acid transport system ATP-binding protein